MRVLSKDLKQGLGLLKTYAVGQGHRNPRVTISATGTLGQARLEINDYNAGAAFYALECGGQGLAAHSVELAAFAATLNVTGRETVEITADGETLTLERSGFSYTLEASPVSLAEPLGVEWTPAQRIDLAAWNLIGAVAGTDQARPVLTAVYLAGDGSELAATDSYRLRVLSLRSPVSGVPSAGALIPAEAIRLGVKALKDTETPAMLSLSARHYRLETGPLTVSGSLIDGTYPNYRQLLGSLPESFAQANVAELASGLKLIIAANKAGKTSAPAVMRFSDREITITGAGVTFGLGTSSGYVGGIAFNPGYLLELANAVAVDDAQALLGLMDHLKPMTVTHGARGEYVSLLMPVRIPETVTV